MLYFTEVNEFNVNNWVDILCYTKHQRFEEIPENVYLSHSSLYERFYLLKKCYQQFNDVRDIYALVNELFKRDYFYENFKEFWYLLYHHELWYISTIEPKFLFPYTFAFFNNLLKYLSNLDTSSKMKTTSTMLKFIEQSLFITDVITVKNRLSILLTRNRSVVKYDKNVRKQIQFIIAILDLLDVVISQLYIQHPKMINYLYNFHLKSSKSTLLARAFEINKTKLSRDYTRIFYESRYEIFTKKVILNNEQMIGLIKSLKYISSLKKIKSFCFTIEQHQLVDALLTIKNSKKLIHIMANKGDGLM